MLQCFYIIQPASTLSAYGAGPLHTSNLHNVVCAAGLAVYVSIIWIFKVSSPSIPTCFEQWISCFSYTMSNIYLKLQQNYKLVGNSWAFFFKDEMFVTLYFLTSCGWLQQTGSRMVFRDTVLLLVLGLADNKKKCTTPPSCSFYQLSLLFTAAGPG